MRSTQSRLRGLAGIVAGTLVVSTLSAAPTQADEPSQPAPHIELQARSNLLVNDEGWNLPPGSSFNSITTALSDDAQIAFPVQIATYPGSPTTSTAAVWLGQGGEGDLAHRLPVNTSISSSVHINDAGDVAFTVGDATANTLWMYEAADEEARQIVTMPVVPVNYSLGGIDEEQNIGFQGGFAGNRAFAAVIDGQGVFYAQDTGLDPESGFSYLYSPTFNDAQQIAGKVSLTESFNHQEIRLFEADGSSQAVLATDNVDPDSPYRSFDNSVGLSDDGQVAAFATLREGNTKVLVRTDGTTVEHVADVSADSPLASFEFFAPDVNTRGEVVFRAVDKDGKRGVWVADGEDLRPVLVEGDVVETDLGLGQLGQHDSSPVFGGSPQINNRGDVSITSGVHPEGNNEVEWGTGVFIAYADTPVDPDPPVGVIEVEPTSLTHEVEFGGTESTEVTFSNTGDADAEVTLSEDADWLTLDPASFDIAADEDVNVAFTTDADGLASGTYTTAVAITTDTGQELDAISVTLTVAEEPAPPVGVIEVDRTAVTHEVEFGGSESTEVTFSNTGDADAEVILSEDADWLTLDPASFDVAADEGVNVAFTTDAEGLASGTYSTDVEITTDTGQELDAISVTLTVAEEPAPPVEPIDVDRWEGTNRYGTAAAVSSTYQAGADVVFLATGLDYPDALTGSALAGSLDAPVLLTRTDALPNSTKAELKRLAPEHVVVLGGDGAVEDAVLAEAAALTGAAVDRLSGTNRYGTAAAVAAEFGATGERVFVAVGLDYPDALSAAARAGALDSPVLLVRPDEIPSATTHALDDLAPSQITLLGGEGVVTKEVMDELADWAPTTRVSGLNRWITSARLFAEVASADTIYLASGQDWPDALAGGAKAASDDEPLLITREDGLPDAIEDAIVRLFPERVVVLGGEGAVADTVIKELEKLRGQD
ncbi:cell wall-binding repeat-containing protein [Ornithinimicrobium sufpigmenti]|uniref:cell wall-binding repeat-containing protein n=1 Tax=Ornithinimicrobium sufpigmenti TaxID=2508882 RepID=UPI00103663FC|nr:MULTISPECIES: cell wall-binding repeat-containing protein [unclassified Ornithinimicrobium]